MDLTEFLICPDICQSTSIKNILNTTTLRSSYLLLQTLENKHLHCIRVCSVCSFDIKAFFGVLCKG